MEEEMKKRRIEEKILNKMKKSEKLRKKRKDKIESEETEIKQDKKRK